MTSPTQRTIELDLPFPPTVNTYWRTVNGRTMISKKGREFTGTVDGEMFDYRQRHALKREPLTDRLSLDITLHPPDKRKRDIDNYLKALLDACTHAGLWEDDEQIDEIHLRRGEIIKGGLVRMKIDVIKN